MNKKLKFEAITKINDFEAIGITYMGGILCRINLLTGGCEYLDIVTLDVIYGKRYYSSAIYYKDKVYFIPSASSEILVYDPTDNKMERIQLKIIEGNPGSYSRNNNFSDAVVYDKYIFLIPCTYPGVVRLDTSDNSLSYFDEWYTGESFMFRKSPVIEGDSFFIPSMINDVVLEFNMAECSGSIRHIGDLNNGCWGICKHNEWFWMAPVKNGPIIKWNDQEIRQLDEYPKDFFGGDFCFTRVFCKDNSIFLLPAKANMGIKVECDTEKLIPWKIMPFSEYDLATYMFRLDSECFLSVTHEGIETNIKLDTETDEVTPFEFYLEKGKDKLESDFKNYIINTKITMRENLLFKLWQFIQLV